MVRFLTSLFVVSLLGACSSTPEFVPMEAKLECTMSKTTVTQNGTHSQSTEENCTNDPIEIAKRQGIDLKTCRQYQNKDAIVNGYRKVIKGVICWDESGNIHKFPSL